MAAKGKKMTMAYWKGLENGTRKRALGFVLGRTVSDWQAEDSLDPDSTEWFLVQKTCKIPEHTDHYKVLINGHTFVA